MELAQRILGINAGGRDGWETFRRARAMVRAGVPVTELSIGEPDIPTDPAILEAMDRAARAGATGYPPIPGLPALRRLIAERTAARTGVPTSPENVLVTPGGQAGLFMCHQAVCDHGATALHPDPHYATYPSTIRSVGARPRAVPCRAEDGFQPRREAILARAEGAVSLLINSPNNPTGVVYGRETLEGVAGACREAGLWLISDEVYETQVWSGSHLSPRALPGMAERTLVVGSLSKSHAMTGSRVGWVIGPARAIAALEALATNTTYGVAGFVQAAALYALSQGEALERQVAAPFRRRRALALGLVGRQQLVRAVGAEGAQGEAVNGEAVNGEAVRGGAMYVMLDIRATGLSGLAFAEALLDARRVAVMPGESFGAQAAGHVRVALTAADERLAAALTDLLEFAAEMGRKAA